MATLVVNCAANGDVSRAYAEQVLTVGEPEAAGVESSIENGGGPEVRIQKPLRSTSA